MIGNGASATQKGFSIDTPSTKFYWPSAKFGFRWTFHWQFENQIKILPELLNECDQVVMFQRTAHYCMPRFQIHFGGFWKNLMNVYPFGLLYRWKEYSLRQGFKMHNWTHAFIDWQHLKILDQRNSMVCSIWWLWKGSGLHYKTLWNVFA